MNPYRAVVPLECKGKTVELCFDYEALAAVQHLFGLTEYQRKLAEILQFRDVKGLAQLLSIASGETVESIKEWSPDLAFVTETLSQAWLMAMFGPTMKPKEEAKQLDPLLAQSNSLISSLLPWLQRWKLGSAGPNSGDSHRTH